MVHPVFSHTKSCKTANSSTFPVTKLTSSGRIFLFLELKRRGYDVFYFQKKQEVDFYIRHETRDALLINVAWNMAGRATRQRELAGLQEAMAELGVSNGLLVTERTEEEIKTPEGNIAVKPLWLWALEERFSPDSQVAD